MARAARVMRWILTAATVAVCLLLCWQAIDIYLTGNSPDNFSAPGVRIAPVYTREVVGERLRALSPALFAYLALAAGGLVLQAAGGEKGKGSNPFQAEERLRIARARAAEIPAEAREEQRRRRNIRLAAGAVMLCCGAAGGAYLLNGDNFSDLNLEPVVGRMMLHVCPWAAVALAAAAAASVLCGRSALREIDLLKTAPRKEDGPAAPPEKPNVLPVLRAVLYAAAILLIALGVSNGGLWDVLVKAVNICTECIGLG